MAWKNSELRAGNNHPLWKGGEGSYRQKMKRSSCPPVCAHCGITNERVLAVHHKDRNRKHNDLENLMWLCHNCHYLEHHPEAPRQQK